MDRMQPLIDPPANSGMVVKMSFTWFFLVHVDRPQMIQHSQQLKVRLGTSTDITIKTRGNHKLSILIIHCFHWLASGRSSKPLISKKLLPNKAHSNEIKPLFRRNM